MHTKENYGGLDCFRLAAAVLVIAIHTSPLTSFSADADFFLTRILARTAVPFFLMVTGHFVASKFMDAEDGRDSASVLPRYLRRILLLYLAGIILYLPIGIYAGHYKDLTPGAVLRMLVFDGTFYHLWYFPACAAGLLLVYLMSRILRIRGMLAVSALLYLFGLMGDSYYGLTQLLPPLRGIYEFAFHIFSYTRNGLFLAPLFLVLGAWLGKSNFMEKYSEDPGLYVSFILTGLTVSFLAMTGEAFYLRNLDFQRHDSMYLMLVPVMIFLYQSLLFLRVKPRKLLRSAALWIYVLHPAVIVVVRGIAKLLKLTALLVENSLVHYLAVTVLSLCAGFGMTMLQRRISVRRAQSGAADDENDSPDPAAPEIVDVWQALEFQANEDEKLAMTASDADDGRQALPPPAADDDSLTASVIRAAREALAASQAESGRQGLTASEPAMDSKLSTASETRENGKVSTAIPASGPGTALENLAVPATEAALQPPAASAIRTDRITGEIRQAKATGRAWIQIDKNALSKNVAFLRSLLPEGCRLMPAVKADAYGHGAVPIARELNRLGVEAFCVACITEGIALREADVKGEILILGYTPPEDFPLLVSYRLTQTVTDYPYAELLARSGRKLHVHVGVDTGMHRLGIRCENIEDIAAVFEMENLVVDGMFTHLSASDSTDAESRAFTKAQADAFYQVAEILEAQGFPRPKLHLQASYGLLNYPFPNADYVRAGILLYGVHSQAENAAACQYRLSPVLSLMARVISIRTLYSGDSAGYGMTFTADRDMRLAVLSIGYADGFPRELSGGRGHVLIHGCKAPVIGRVCMDLTLVDISHIPQTQVGDIAVIVGRSGQLEITAEEIAAQCGTITNELLSRLGPRLERIMN